jgi:hypothetical protein
MTHIGLHDLKDLPIPSSIVLGKLVKQPNQLEQSCSICYSHLPLSSRHSRFPLWILTYWVEVSRLRQHVRQPWASAELYLTVQRKRWKLENIRKLCDAAHTALLNLPWAGNVCGFEEPEPRTKLAAYLSQKWLSTSHIDQQLDLLRMDVERSGQLTCEVVRQSFFRKVVELYRDHEDKPYNKETSGARHLWTIGEELASGTRDKLCGVVNIDNSHWVGVVIDAFRSLVLYGDSLGGSDLELKSAISWWIQCHTDRTFKHQHLPITTQVDGYNCSVLAINAIGSDALPWQIELISALSHDELRIATFNRIANRDLEFVSVKLSTVSMICLM